LGGTWWGDFKGGQAQHNSALALLAALRHIGAPHRVAAGGPWVRSVGSLPNARPNTQSSGGLPVRVCVCWGSGKTAIAQLSVCFSIIDKN